jgi:hypothetical protein
MVSRATPRTTDLAALSQAFAELEANASRRDMHATMRTLQRLVPEFQPPVIDAAKTSELDLPIVGA